MVILLVEDDVADLDFGWRARETRCRPVGRACAPVEVSPATLVQSCVLMIVEGGVYISYVFDIKCFVLRNTDTATDTLFILSLSWSPGTLRNVRVCRSCAVVLARKSDSGTKLSFRRRVS
jgi:hypothetical protein